MDGVIYHGNKLVEGSKEFVEWLKKQGKKFIFLTNSSAKSPKELEQKLSHMGIEVDANHFITSARATASFLASQKPSVGDRMDTDIVAGIESGIETALVLSGITKIEDLTYYPYQPNYILNRAADIITMD